MPETGESVKVVITVDGSAASGKTALARKLAEALGFQHLNSGLLYRGVAWLALQTEVAVTDEQAILGLLREKPLSLSVGDSGTCELLIASSPCKADLTASVVSSTASVVAQLPNVRTLLLEPQRSAFPGYGIVAEGRDMGTIVFPDAPVKFFVDARLDVRAGRRWAQMIARGEDVSQDDVARELRERDINDSTRLHAPMVKSQDSILVDNSDRTLEETVAAMVQEVRSRVYSET
jgi:cytidylate kinase